MNIAENIEGRERYPINVRYQRDFRDNVEELRRVSDRHALRRADPARTGGATSRFRAARR